MKNNKDQDQDFLKISLINQNVSVRKKKKCPLKSVSLDEINYKNLSLLRKFISERGRIVSNRATELSIKKQREVAKAIKIARKLALLSPISNL
jgi:small subunit ribosomal protein S18